MARTIWHNKRETIARVEREYRALDAVVRRLGSAGLDEPVPGFGSRARITRERWLRKDALAHIVEWKRAQLRALRKDPADPTMKGLDLAQKNRRLYERWHGRTAREVIAFHRTVGREIRAAMRAAEYVLREAVLADLAERSGGPLDVAPRASPRDRGPRSMSPCHDARLTH